MRGVVWCLLLLQPPVFVVGARGVQNLSLWGVFLTRRTRQLVVRVGEQPLPPSAVRLTRRASPGRRPQLRPRALARCALLRWRADPVACWCWAADVSAGAWDLVELELPAAQAAWLETYAVLEIDSPGFEPPVWRCPGDCSPEHALFYTRGCATDTMCAQRWRPGRGC